MADHQVYDCAPEDLGALLHDFFKDESIDEVIVDHPVDGPKVITREYYMELVAAAAEKTHTLEAAKRMRESFGYAMTMADVRTIDITSDDQNFGFDIHGKKIEGIGGMTLIDAAHYPPNIALIDNEVGCYFDEECQRRAVRLVTEK